MFKSTPIEAFDVGDRGVFTVVEGDVTVGREGVIGVIEFYGKNRRLVSPEGVTLASYDVSKPRHVYAVMVKKYEPTPTRLDGL